MTIDAFKYAALPSEVIFGAGVLEQVSGQLANRGYRRALVLCTPEQREQAERVAQLLGSVAVGIHDKAVMHVPIEVAREAINRAAELSADCAVAIGGGSTIGLGKAIALESSIPIVAIPTTYAGSEMTPIYGLTEGGVKRTGRNIRVLPKLVLYDPRLTLTLPVALSVTSGVNAIAHAVEGLYASDRNPVLSLMAEEGIRAIASALPRLTIDGLDVGAREECLYGAWLCGTVLGSTSAALHHKLCHTLGGTFNLPHAETHTIVLPHAVAYNQRSAPDAMKRIARALGSSDAATGLWDLAKACGAPLALRDIGMPRDGISIAAKLALANPYANPREITLDGITALLSHAWAGDRPSPSS
ncbi:MAG TPA: maleylacetate reductase [Vicinamibacterales bacterium]|nr:maleylacetate reductase [Vicinamibacterales bacterium]